MTQAIQTRWRGYHFRSRTEARWAVFFTALGLRWDYERERYDLPSGSYLPDFYVYTKRGGLWAEIKGEEFTPLERTLCIELAQAVGAPCLLLDGPPDFAFYEIVFPSGKTRHLRIIRPDAHESAVYAARAARFEGGRPRKEAA